MPLSGKSILVIEDEPLIAMEAESSLKDAGATSIKMVNSVSAAHDALNGDKFDAAVVNLRLADGDGSPLVGMLSKHGIPVVVTTGFSADQAPVARAAAFLEKPYRESDLIETITRLTKTWRRSAPQSN